MSTSPSRQRLVVVGGDAAGMSAASQARRMAPNLEIVALERGRHVSYSACGEPYLVGGEVGSIEDLVVRTPAQFADLGIEVHTQHEVKEIDLDRRVVAVVPMDGPAREYGFDLLMYATGATPLRPAAIDGIDKPGVLGLRSLIDARDIRDVVDGGVRRPVIVGGGYIGLEVAEALSHRGLPVTMVTSGSHVLERTFDMVLGERANEAVRRLGIDLHTNLRINSILGAEKATGAAGDDAEFPADLVVIGLGTGPEAELARAAGIPLGKTGAVAVDDHQLTGIEGVWSAGDCAEATQLVSGQQVNIALGTVANKAGRVAGTNIAGGDVRFPGVLGTAITKVGEVEMARTGLTAKDSIGAGFDPVVGIVQGTNTAGYWPTAARVDLMVIADRSTGLLLGGQIVGGPGSGKKIDVIATAIWAGMTAADLAWVDLAYAPPFAGVWDLIHIAARRAAEG